MKPWQKITSYSGSGIIFKGVRGRDAASHNLPISWEVEKLKASRGALPLDTWRRLILLPLFRTHLLSKGAEKRLTYVRCWSIIWCVSLWQRICNYPVSILRDNIQAITAMQRAVTVVGLESWRWGHESRSFSRESTPWPLPRGMPPCRTCQRR